jgi:hypothetical protein
MKMVRIVILAVSLWGGGIYAGFSLSLEALLGDEVAKQLVAEGEVRGNDDDAEMNVTPRYVPLMRVLWQSMEAVKPTVVMEVLYLYTKPPTANREMWTAEERGAIYNEALALSTLDGLEYFSRRRNRMHLLYERSRVVDEADTKRALPDPVYQTPPSRLELTVRQKDTKFGDNVYRLAYLADEQSLIVTQGNISTIMLAIIPVVSKGNLQTVVAMFDAGPYILIYSVAMARTILLPGTRDEMFTSIGNRTVALLTWFSRRADLAYEKTGRASLEKPIAMPDDGAVIDNDNANDKNEQ